MRRRALLASLASGVAGLAGCSTLGDASSGGPDTEPPGSDPSTGSGTITAAPVPTAPPGTAIGGRTGRPTDRGTDDEPRRPDSIASVIDLRTGPRTYAFAPTTVPTDGDATVTLRFDRTATAEHPARLVGRLGNDTDSDVTVQLNRIPAVGRVHARGSDDRDDTATLHLAPTTENELAEAVPDLARADDGRWVAASVGDWMTDRVRLEPGDLHRLAYAVVGGPDSAGVPTGTYAFTGDRDARITVWDTTSPGPEAESRFAGVSVPTPRRGDPDGDGRSVQWYHEADRTTPVFVRPSTERLELDGHVTFTVVNHSREGLRCGGWNVYKLVDGEWFYLGPRVQPAVCQWLAPGARAEWTLRALNGALPSRTGRFVGYTRAHLGGGRYGVVAGYGHRADASAALVELAGPPVEVVPTDGTTAERDGDEVTVTTARYGDGEFPSDAAFAVKRADETDGDAERVIPEQLMAERTLGPPNGLRNALPFFDPEVERVVVRTDENVRNWVLPEDGSERRFRLRDETYAVTDATEGDGETPA